MYIIIIIIVRTHISRRVTVKIILWYFGILYNMIILYTVRIFMIYILYIFKYCVWRYNRRQISKFSKCLISRVVYYVRGKDVSNACSRYIIIKNIFAFRESRTILGDGSRGLGSSSLDIKFILNRVIHCMVILASGYLVIRNYWNFVYSKMISYLGTWYTWPLL